MIKINNNYRITIQQLLKTFLTATRYDFIAYYNI